MSSELWFVEWRFFEWNWIAKWVILFARFFLALRLFARKPEIKRKILVMPAGMCEQINIFEKIIPNMRFWIIYILVQILFFQDTTLESFSQILLCHQPWWLTFLFSPCLHHLKLPQESSLHNIWFCTENVTDFGRSCNYKEAAKGRKEGSN